MERNNQLVMKELYFNRLVLMKHVKCESAYVHRRWLIKRLLFADETDSTEFFSDETKLIYCTLSKKVKANYYCWTYLNWILEHLLQTKPNFNLDPLMRKVLINLEALLYVNPSDFCLFHTRLNLISVLDRYDKLNLFLIEEKYHVDNQQLIFKFLLKEIELSDDLLVRYPEYVTVWNYRKYLYIVTKFKTRAIENGVSFDLINAKFLKNLYSRYLLQGSEISVETDYSVNNWFTSLLERDLELCNILINVNQCALVKNNFLKYSEYLKKFLFS